MRFVVASALLIACSSNGSAERPATMRKVAAAAEDEGKSRAAEPPVASGALTSEMARSYFAGGPAEEAARRFALEDWEAARKGFQSALGAAEDDEQKARLRLMIALCDAEQDAWEDAAEGFAEAAGSLPRIADWVRYQAARASYFAHAPDEAIERARAVSPDSIAGADAALLIGDALRSKEAWKEMAEHYEGYLEAGKHRIRRTEARFRLAQAYEETGRAVPDAIRLYRRITIRAPTSPWSEKASERLDALLPRLPKARRRRFAELDAREHLRRGMAYFHRQRHEEAAADLKAALEDGLSARRACVAAYHRAQTFWNRRNRTRSAPLFDRALALCKKAKHDDLQVKAAYQAGRSYDRLDEAEKAIERFSRIERDHPEHTYADDARLRQAEQYEELGKEEKVDALLASIPERYPDGDMRAKALWRRGWRAFKEEEYEEAIRWFKKQIEAVPLETHWAREGQPQYWIGRAHAELGRGKKAVEAYEAAVRTYPLSYYALLALNRLRKDHPERFRALTRELRAPPEGYEPDQPAFQFQKRPVYEKPGFARALEFLRLGLGAQAEIELRRVGLAPPGGRDPVEDEDEREKLWAMVFLYDAAGRYDKSHWVTRYHLTEYQRSWPVGKMRARWRLAYPLAWRDLLERHAKKQGFPTDLFTAIVREESGFDPLRESWANAIGLSQLILPTARRFAEGTGITVNRENLRDPEKNVTIGSRFFGFLHEEFGGRAALMIPSYNAGEGATRRWLRERGDWAQDAWSEEIPYDQTRRYAKRVLATYFAYTYLRDGTIPEIPNEIPDDLIPEE